MELPHDPRRRPLEWRNADQAPWFGLGWWFGLGFSLAFFTVAILFGLLMLWLATKGLRLR